MTKPEIMQFGNGYRCYRFVFHLGRDYRIPRWRGGEKTWRVVRFVKVTRKGFNLLDLETSKCLFPRTKLYDRKWSGKDIPPEQKRFEVQMPAYFPVPEPVASEEEKSS